jgi:hypothetical protein
MVVYPITECIDRETQSTVAIATTEAKAAKIVAALTALNPNYKYYSEDGLTVDTIPF